MARVNRHRDVPFRVQCHADADLSRARSTTRSGERISVTPLSQSGRQKSPSTALGRDRLGVISVVFFVISAAAPLTTVAGVVPTGIAVTGLTGVSLAYLVVAVVLGLFSIGYVAMARHIANAGAFYAYIALGIGRPFGIGASWAAVLG